MVTVINTDDSPRFRDRTHAGQGLARKLPGATHLFEEPGKQEVVSRLAGEWFESHL